MATAIRKESDMDADKVKFRGVGKSFTATASATTNGDFVVSEARLIDGIQVVLKDHAFGDSIALYVVDVDNMLGYGAGAVLDSFATNWYVAADTQSQGVVRLPYGAEVVAGLYVRLAYTSVGGTNVSVNFNLFAHKYLV